MVLINRMELKLFIYYDDQTVCYNIALNRDTKIHMLRILKTSFRCTYYIIINK